MSAAVSQKLTAAALIERLTEDILHGTRMPGEQLQETALSQQLGVSRNTLREAFRILEHQGLIEYFPHRGVFVRTYSADEVHDLYRFRSIFEGAVILQLREEAKAFSSALSVMRQAIVDARTARDNNRWVAVGTENFRFHQAIFDAAGSPRISDTAQSMLLQTRLAFLSARSSERMHAPFIEGNAEIHAALKAAEFKEAANLLQDYLIEAERKLIEELER